MLLTVPVVKDVVTVVNRADWAMPNRTSLPSMLPMDWLRPISASLGLPCQLGEVAHGQADEEDDAHGHEHGAALAAEDGLAVGQAAAH